jgi:hypothetical protein
MTTYNVTGQTQQRIAEVAAEEGLSEGMALAILVMFGSELRKQLFSSRADYVVFTEKELNKALRKARSLEAE